MPGALEAVDDGLRCAAEIEDPRLRIQCLLRRGQVLSEAGRLQEAERALTEALSTDEEVQGYLAPLLHAHLASVLLALGRKAQARREAERAMALRDRAGGMYEGDAETFLVGHDVGVPGALAQGWSILRERAEGITDPALRRTFLTAVPAHARILALARQAGLCADDPKGPDG